MSPSWIDAHRACEDSGKHEGDLELITWESVSEFGDKLGWGNIVVEESDEMKQKFEAEFNGSQEKLYEHWPRAFRWTCCGTDGNQKYGCDHHGSGSKACSCDFCRMGQKIRTSIHKKRATHGLKFSRGPDPRSKCCGQEAALHEAMRKVLGMS